MSDLIDSICSICYTDLINQYHTECNHVFCIECILKWSNTNLKSNIDSTCPMCRSCISNERIKEALKELDKNISPESIFSFEEFIKLKGVVLHPKLDIICLTISNQNNSEWTLYLKDIISERTRNNFRNNMFETITLQIKDTKMKFYNIHLQIYNAIYRKILPQKLISDGISNSKSFSVEVKKNFDATYKKILEVFENMTLIHYVGYEFVTAGRDFNRIKLVMPNLYEAPLFDNNRDELDVDKIPGFGSGNFMFYPKMIVCHKDKKIFLKFTLTQAQIILQENYSNKRLFDRLCLDDTQGG